MDSLVEAKLLLPHEADRLEKVDFRSNEDQLRQHNLNLCGPGHHMTKSFQDPPRGDLGPSLVGVEPSVQSAPGRQNHPRAPGDHFGLEINVKHGAGVGKHGDCV